MTVSTIDEGTPISLWEAWATKAMVGPFSVKRCFYGAKAIPEGISTAALCLPRGNGKSFLAGHILRCAFGSMQCT